jgi:hypothetical protein
MSARSGRQPVERFQDGYRFIERHELALPLPVRDTLGDFSSFIGITVSPHGLE